MSNARQEKAHSQGPSQSPPADYAQNGKTRKHTRRVSVKPTMDTVTDVKQEGYTRPARNATAFRPIDRAYVLLPAPALKETSDKCQVRLGVESIIHLMVLVSFSVLVSLQEANPTNGGCILLGVLLLIHLYLLLKDL
ncbi:hypothetical protein DFH28DRAFT_1128294 [Melampsora americana]|nr:hypothetical protein DFH28DRAFT_1139208 [Melampsora americana]KAH9808280.1 hypothetical protein DFH28DRAFT_1136375 [Melampsora americana]KAH9813648.1 hypothetical protein DFH28DRAFT_1128294 [Melampsora americana]